MVFTIILSILSLLNPLATASSVAQVNAHEFHLSNCEIEHRPGQSSITLVAHIFIDDLELELKSLGFDSLYIMTEKENPKANDIISGYLNENLKLIADGNELSYSFLGKEPSEDLIAIWCYMEVTEIPNFESIEIKNTVLLSSFEDQKNITSFMRADQSKQHFLFERGDEIQKVDL